MVSHRVTVIKLKITLVIVAVKIEHFYLKHNDIQSYDSLRMIEQPFDVVQLVLG